VGKVECDVTDVERLFEIRVVNHTLEIVVDIYVVIEGWFLRQGVRKCEKWIGFSNILWCGKKQWEYKSNIR